MGVSLGCDTQSSMVAVVTHADFLLGKCIFPLFTNSASGGG